MMLLIHILIAFSSLFYTAVTYMYPSKRKLQGSYLFVAATLATGTYLVIATPSHMLQACMSGLIYLGIIMTAIVFTHRKLATREANE